MRKSFLVIAVVFLLIGGIVSSYQLKTNLRFSHRTHHRSNISCEKCHVDSDIPVTHTKPASHHKLPSGWQPLRPTRILTNSPIVVKQHEDMGDSFGRPGEKRCLQCHFKTREKADCALCHLDTPGVTVRDRDRLPDFVVFEHSKHKNHECMECHMGINGWEKLDGDYCNTTMDSCLRCHNTRQASKDCTICHNPTPRPKDHVRNFYKKHGTPYRANPARCRTCHEDSSCVACHSRKPANHTLAWVSRRHGLAARTNPLRCQACHADKWVCKRCHDNF